MKCAVNWIPLKVCVDSRNTQPLLNQYWGIVTVLGFPQRWTKDVCCFVFIKHILRNRYGPGVSSQRAKGNVPTIEKILSLRSITQDRVYCFVLCPDIGESMYGPGVSLGRAKGSRTHDLESPA